MDPMKSAGVAGRRVRAPGCGKNPTYSFEQFRMGSAPAVPGWAHSD